MNTSQQIIDPEIREIQLAAIEAVRHPTNKFTEVLQPYIGLMLLCAGIEEPLDNSDN